MSQIEGSKMQGGQKNKGKKVKQKKKKSNALEAPKDVKWELNDKEAELSNNALETSENSISPQKLQIKETERQNDEAEKNQKKSLQNQGIQDRLWEKEQLQEINLRVDNIFNVFGAKIGEKKDNHFPGLDENVLSEFRDQQNKAMKDLSDNFLNKEAKKAKELADAKAEIRALQEKCEEMGKDLKDLGLKNDKLKKDNTNLKNEKDDAIREKDKVLTESQSLKDSLEAQLQALSNENDKLLKIKASAQDPEDELQKRFAAKLAEMLQERDDYYGQLKDQMDDTFQRQMKEMEKNNDKQMEDLKDAIDAQKKELADLQMDLSKKTQERDQATRDLEKERPLREALENELKRHKENTKDEIKRVKDKADQVQKDYRQMCDDYFALEKINLDLRVEIQALKQKLDKFEEQHKIESPLRAKKRRRTESSLLEPKVLKSVQGPLIDSQSLFPLECVMWQYEGDWTGFELQNQWNKPIILKGWFLSDIDQSSRLSLPEKKLDPSETIRVCLTETKKESTDLVWKGLKMKKGDRHELWAEDSLGLRHKIATVSVPTNPGFTPDSCFVM